MELNRMKGEVSEELRRSFEGWTMTTRLRQHASADCFYRPDGRRTRILAALPREFTYAELKRVIKSHGGSKVDERIMATHLNHQTTRCSMPHHRRPPPLCWARRFWGGRRRGSMRMTTAAGTRTTL